MLAAREQSFIAHAIMTVSLWVACVACSVLYRSVQQNMHVELGERSTKEWTAIEPPLIPSAFWAAETSCIVKQQTDLTVVTR